MMIKRLHKWIWIGLLALLFGLPANSLAQTESPLSLTVRAGFDGIYKAGSWIPVQVMLANEGPDVEALVQISRPQSTSSGATTYSRTVSLPTQSRKAVSLYLPAEGFTRRLKVEVVAGDNVIAEAEVLLDEADISDLVYGVWASSPSAFILLRDVAPVGGNGWMAQLEASDLPSVAAAWQTLDVLVISDVDTGVLSPAQQQALYSWVAHGGRLIVAGGPGWQKTTAGLGDILPADVTGTATIDDLGNFGVYAYTNTSPSGEALISTLLLNNDATPLLQAGGAAMIAEVPVGYGYIDLFAFDPALDPFRSWDELDSLYRTLLSNTTGRPSWASGNRNWYNATEAINVIPGLSLPSAWLLCGFLGLYVLVIGPINYFVLRQLKRRVLAWLTIPTLVIIFSAIAYSVGFGLRGNRPIIHRLMVVESWETSSQSTVNGLIGVFSPRRDSYDVRLTTEGTLARPLPSDLYYGTSASTIDNAAIVQGDTYTIDDMRVDVAEIKSFAITGQTESPNFTSDLTLVITGNQATLAGTISNLSEVSLTDTVLLTTGGAQQLGDIAPGDTVSVNLNLNISQATPASIYQYGQVLPPLPPALTGIAPAPSSGYGYYGYGYGYYDTTIDDIMGYSNYYDDAILYRRFMLLSWLMDPYNNGGRGNATFLAGWAEDVPLDVEITDSAYRVEDMSLHLINFEPELVIEQDQVVLPPGLMTWEILDPGSFGEISPYDAYWYQGRFALRFQPHLNIHIGEVDSLVMHLESYNTSGNIPADIIISLWDNQTGQWIELQNPVWGDNLINQADRFVGPTGNIDVHVQITGSGISSYNIERLDFTLVVEQ